MNINLRCYDCQKSEDIPIINDTGLNVLLHKVAKRGWKIIVDKKGEYVVFCPDCVKKAEQVYGVKQKVNQAFKERGIGG